MSGDKNELCAFRIKKKRLDKIREFAKDNDRTLSAELRRRLKRSWKV